VKNKNIRDLRKYAQSTSFRLILGGLLLIFVIGEILIYFFYGISAAATGILCITAGLTPVVLILVALWLIDWISKRNQQ